MAHWLLRSKDFSYQKLETAFTNAGKRDEFAEINRRIMKNDLWLDGEGYIAAPPVQEDPNAQILWLNLKRTFVSENVIQDMVWRVRDSIFGSSSDWKIELSPEAQAEAEAKKKAEAKKPPAPEPNEPPTPPNAPPTNPPEPNQPPANNPPAPEPANPSEPPASEEEAEEAIDPLVSEADKLLTHYWDNSDILEVLRDALEDRLVEGRGAIRVYVPARFRNENGTLKTEIKTLADALAVIRVEKVDNESARILDEEGERISLYKAKRTKDFETGETEEVFEFSFVDDAGFTFVGTIARDDFAFMQPATASQPALPISAVNPLGISAGANANQPTGEGNANGFIAALRAQRAQISNPLKLGGGLTLTEVSGAPYITEQLRKCNGGVNLNLTMGVHATVEGGFSEMATLNADVEMVKVPDRNEPSGYKEVPKAMKRGGNAVQNLVGIRTFDSEKGVENYTNAGVAWKDPTPMTSFKDGKQLYYESCLEAGGQKFITLSSDGNVGEESRQLAEKDYLRRARPFKRDADKLGGGTINAVLRLAAELIGKSGYFDRLSIKFDAVVDISIITADSRRVMMDEVEKGLRSEESYMTKTGTENPTAERETIAREKREKYAMQQQFGLTKFPAADPNAPPANNPNQPNPPNQPPNAPANK